jgi:small subunit ribosomal protein S5
METIENKNVTSGTDTNNVSSDKVVNKTPITTDKPKPAFTPRPAGERGSFPARPAGGSYTPRPAGDRRPFTPRPAGERGSFPARPAGGSYTPRPAGERGSFPPRDGARKFGDRPAFGNSKFGNKSKFGGKKDFRKPLNSNEPEMFSEVITVRRVTRVVKGGKRMRFAALVVVGDKKGLIGFANRKGMDYQDAVAKATKKAKENMIKINLNEDFSLPFSTITKFKSAQILLKPATKGTSLIAGGYIRPVLELVGIKNIYSKIQGSNNKIVGVEAVYNALKKYI